MNPCTTNNPCTILLLEDNRDQVDLMKAYVALDGGGRYRVNAVSASSDALAYIKKHPVSIMLMDLFVEDTKGLETFKVFAEYVHHFPIIILTGFADKGLCDIALSMGAQDYVIKGDYLGRAMMGIIERAVSRHKDVVELTQLILNLNAQISVLKGDAQLGDNNKFRALEEIATSIEQKAKSMKAA